MRKLLGIFGLLVILATFSSGVFAAGLNCYSVQPSTAPYQEATTMSADISGTVRVHKIVISADATTALQTVSFYKNATSTTAISLDWEMNIPTSSIEGNFQYNWDIHSDYYKVANPMVRVSTMTNNVDVTFFYR
jgi:hypothetical protein